MKLLQVSFGRIRVLLAMLLLVFVLLLMLQTSFPPLERYPHWDGFLVDAWSVGHLAALRQAIRSFELPVITPYVNFGWNALGDSSAVQHYLNPIHWLVLVLDPTLVIIVRTFVFFSLGAIGSFLLIQRLTNNTGLSYFGGLLFCVLPMNLTPIYYGTNFIVPFIYCTPFLLFLIHAALDRPIAPRFLGFTAYCVFATSAGDVYGLVALPCIIGVYVLFVAWLGYGRPILSAFAIGAALVLIWLLASAFYVVPFAYNMIQNAEFYKELIRPEVSVTVSDVYELLMQKVFPSLFNPSDEGISFVIYVPVFCLIMIAAGVGLWPRIFRAQRVLAAAFVALVAVALMLVAETFVFYSIPAISASPTVSGILRYQMKILPFIFMLASLLAVSGSFRSGGVSGRRLVLGALLLAFAIDVGMFIVPEPQPAVLRTHPFWIDHGAPTAPFESANLISVRFLDDMWPVLVFANLMIGATILAFARLRDKATIWIVIVAPVAILCTIAYGSLFGELRLQQNTSAWMTRSNYLISSYDARKSCISNLIDRSDPQFRTLYTGQEVFQGFRGRNWKFIAETELHEADAQKVLFSYRQTTNPITPLIRNSFDPGYIYSRWGGVFPPAVEEVRESPDLVRRIGVKWIVSADTRLEEPSPRRPLITLAGDNFNFGWADDRPSEFAGKKIIVEVLMRTLTPNKFAVEIQDGISSSVSVQHSGDGQWEWVIVGHQTAPDAKRLSVRIVQAAKKSQVDYVHLAEVKVSYADGTPFPVSLIAFSDWSQGREMPSGWGFDGGRATLLAVHPNTLDNQRALALAGDGFDFGWVDEDLGTLVGKTLKVEVLMKADQAEKFAVQIDDGVSQSASIQHKGGGKWEELTVRHRIDPHAKRMSIRVVHSVRNGNVDYAVVAKVRAVTEDGIEIPIDLARFADWASWKPLPSGWRFENGANRATIISAGGEEPLPQRLLTLYSPHGTAFNLTWANDDASDLAGKNIHLDVVMQTGRERQFSIQIDDGVSTSTSRSHSGGGRWELLTVDHQISRQSKGIRIRVVHAEPSTNPQSVGIAGSAYVHLAQVSISLANGTQYPISLDAFAAWSTSEPLPPGWRLEGVVDGARVLKIDQGPIASQVTYKGQCYTPPGPWPGRGVKEDGPIYVYELKNPRGVAFMADRFERRNRQEILSRMFNKEWDEEAVLVEEDTRAELDAINDRYPTKSEVKLREAAIIADGFNHMTIAAATDRARPLVLSMAYQPFWRASIDGTASPILRAYGGFMAILVPSGRHTVVLKYVPWDAYLGLLITLGTLIWTIVVTWRGGYVVYLLSRTFHRRRSDECGV